MDIKGLKALKRLKKLLDLSLQIYSNDSYKTIVVSDMGGPEFKGQN